MSNKNPFELRTEILQMAKDYAEKQYQINSEFAAKAFEEAKAAGKATMESWKEFAPVMYSIDDIMKHAEKLYSFVSTSK